jgi:hypothetical protein
MVNLNEISASELLGINNNKRPERDTRTLVLSYIRQNPDGVTAKMVAEAASISERRSRTILGELCQSREIYDRKLPDVQSHLFYPNGRLIHKYLQKSKDLGSQIFRISFHEGRKEPRIQIQERKFTLLEGEKVEGSIFVNYNNLEAFTTFLDEMLVRFNQFKKENRGENK